MEITKEDILNLSYQIIGAAISVHKQLGPGLLESTYHKCMKEELLLRNLPFLSELKIPLEYNNKAIQTDFRCDFYVANIIVVELKSVENFIPLFDAQVLTYMKLLQAPKGILINFNVLNIFKQGQRTLVNELYRELPK